MDLFRLTKSKTREKILRLFFTDPEKKYYLRELERIINEPVGNIRREILNLEKDGLFRREKMGKQVYFSLNKKSAIFEELKKIISKTIGVQALVKKKLSKIKNINLAFIYGSFAQNREDSLSDIDLFIVGQVKEDVIYKAIVSLEKELNREINYVIFSKKDISRKVKSDQGAFLNDVLRGCKIFLIGNQNVLKEIIRSR